MTPPVGTILHAGNRPRDHADHLHVEPPARARGVPPLTNPGMTAGIKTIYESLEAEFGPGAYFLDRNGRYVGNDRGVYWTHMGGYHRRRIAGSTAWSQHAYWNALDIGPYVGVQAQKKFLDFLTGQTTTGDDDMTPEQAEFLNTMMDTAKKQGTSAYFLAGIIPAYRQYPAAFQAIRRRLDVIESQLGDIRRGGAGELSQGLLDEITDVKKDLDRIQAGLAEAAGI